VHEQKLKGTLKRITQGFDEHEGFDTINFQTKISNKKYNYLLRHIVFHA
jgi:hypothetical protein